MRNIDLSEKKPRKIIKHKNLLSNIRMGKKILTFGDIKLEKHKLYRYENPIF